MHKLIDAETLIRHAYELIDTETEMVNIPEWLDEFVDAEENVNAIPLWFIAQWAQYRGQYVPGAARTLRMLVEDWRDSAETEMWSN